MSGGPHLVLGIARESVIARTAFVATYPPRRCGIATFTYDLVHATGGGGVAVLDPAGAPDADPPEVTVRIRRDDVSEYRRAARQLNGTADVVSIQHEYGIWGGPDGSHVLDFVRALRVPTAVTMHTVLRRPTVQQRAILTELGSLADAIVVMSRSAADLLLREYDVDRGRLSVIHHGVPDVPLIDSERVKPGLGLEGRQVILSFGLLGPGKGLELAIDALPAVVKRHPAALYVILGATHPELIRTEGEAYRESLLAEVERVGMGDHVRFADRFVSLPELTRWLEAADVFVTPYPNLGQIVSGTLSYAMGAGRAIVSTPYTYATELLAEGRGILVPAGSPGELAAALTSLLADAHLRSEIGRRAHAFSRRMIWPAVGAEYRAIFDRLGGRSSPPAVMPAVPVGV